MLDRAVMEHNILAISKIYLNIRIEDLGVLLGISAEKAEASAARMLCESRLKGFIDQIEGFLYFDTGTFL